MQKEIIIDNSVITFQHIGTSNLYNENVISLEENSESHQEFMKNLENIKSFQPKNTFLNYSLYSGVINNQKISSVRFIEGDAGVNLSKNMRKLSDSNQVQPIKRPSIKFSEIDASNKPSQPKRQSVKFDLDVLGNSTSSKINAQSVVKRASLSNLHYSPKDNIKRNSIAFSQLSEKDHISNNFNSFLSTYNVLNTDKTGGLKRLVNQKAYKNWTLLLLVVRVIQKFKTISTNEIKSIADLEKSIEERSIQNSRRKSNVSSSHIDLGKNLEKPQKISQNDEIDNMNKTKDFFGLLKFGSKESNDIIERILKNDLNKLIFGLNKKNLHIVNIKNTEGFSPLYIVVINGNLNLVKILMENGANHLIKNVV